MIRSRYLKVINFIVVSIITSLFLFQNSLYANEDCRYKVFSIKALGNITTNDLLHQLSIECGFSILVKDKIAKKRLNKKIESVNLNKISLSEIFDILLKDNNLIFTFKDNLLQIYGIATKTFKIDYITSDRSGKAVLNASVQSNGSDTRSGAIADENQISTSESFNFWKDISNQILSIANTGSEEYIVKDPIINQNAGLITITGTKQQIQRVQKYLSNIKERLNKEVLIDVCIISVILDKAHSSGVDWTQFAMAINNPTGSSVPILDGTSSGLNSANFNASGDTILHLGWNNAFNFTNTVSFTMNGLINFLKTQGRSRVISNPKILTLNNQQALITIGDNINYRIPQTAPVNTGGTITATSYANESIFVGILLNIMPQISDNNEIMLRINPSISSFKYAEDNVKQTQPREIAPDTTEKKLSTVVRVKNGDTIILGGLIGKSKNISINGIPGLKDLPMLGGLFRSEQISDSVSELIFVITPKIINPKSKSSKISLKKLGYENISGK